MDKIPPLNLNGELPPGEYVTTLSEIKEVYGHSSLQRRVLISGLEKAIENLKNAGVKKVWIDGSFITSKTKPNDIDGCWEYTQVVDLEKIDQVFLSKSRKFMKEKYGVEFFPACIIEGSSGLPFPKFFQVNRDGDSKGILLISL